ncbi:MAG: MBOAT family protein [Lachnospiraceae bacterium]|nr:MBOAT family protein [Lachnospiraceae bacterium]
MFMFLPIVLGGYYALRGPVRNYWLLGMSLVFFAWSQPKYLWIILVNIAVNYLAAMLMQNQAIKKPILLCCILINLGLLFYFKYFDFVLESVNSLLNRHLLVPEIILPIGISFFTFQGMSYSIDVYRGTVPVQKNPFKVALYIVLFPQLIAGPIVRYTDVVREIDTRTVGLEDFTYGIQRFVVGLGKKVILANSMASVCDTIWARGAGNSTVAVAWLGSIAYTLQIFYDFSGYSDMAIGLGRMFGFHFNENFRLPYISKSISEFWRRWHISLNTWFRDYVYIPLGGNRKHVYRNLAIVFLLTGIWHGAAWNFIFWGIWNGLFILAERYHGNSAGKKDQKEKGGFLKQSVGLLYTLFVVNAGWVLFRAPDLKAAGRYILNMIGITRGGSGFTLESYLDPWTLLILFLSILFASSIPSRVGESIEKKWGGRLVLSGKYLLLIGMFLFCMMRIVAGTYNPFIYFQF